MRKAYPRLFHGDHFGRQDRVDDLVAGKDAKRQLLKVVADVVDVGRGIPILLFVHQRGDDRKVVVQVMLPDAQGLGSAHDKFQLLVLHLVDFLLLHQLHVPLVDLVDVGDQKQDKDADAQEDQHGGVEQGVLGMVVGNVHVNEHVQQELHGDDAADHQEAEKREQPGGQGNALPADLPEQDRERGERDQVHTGNEVAQGIGVDDIGSAVGPAEKVEGEKHHAFGYQVYDTVHASPEELFGQGAPHPEEGKGELGGQGHKEG